jgi:uncharacterized membrane protein YozB (DUF420 family)
MSALAVLISILALRYLTLNPEVFFPEQRDVYAAHLTILIMHISGGAAALLLGPTQFSSGLRRRAIRWHRALGVAYAASVGVGVLGGFQLALVAYGGAGVRAGFLALATSWLVCTVAAVIAITRGRVAVHRRFMIRSYALTFAAVTLRLWQGVFAGVGVPFDLAYGIVAWLAWIPNLAIVEVYFVRERRRSASRRSPPPLTTTAQR